MSSLEVQIRKLQFAYMRRPFEIREQSPKYADQQMQLLSLNYMNLGRCWWMIKELDKATAAYQKSLHIIRRLEDLMGTPFAQYVQPDFFLPGKL